MPVTFLIPHPLRPFAGGRSHIVFEQSPTNLADALEALWKRCPGLRDRVVTEQAEIREHINIFVGNEDVRYTGGVQTPIPDGAEISIIPAISGGSGTKRQNATHLDQFRGTWEATVNPENNSGIGSYHFIAANGDSIFATVVGHAELVEPPDVFSVEETNTITGGTGRFAGVKGSFTVVRLVNFTTVHLRFVPRDHYFRGCRQALKQWPVKSCSGEWIKQLGGATDRRLVSRHRSCERERVARAFQPPNRRLASH